MISAVDQRKNKFNRYKDLRENPTEMLEPAIKPVKEYDVWDRLNDIADEGTFEEFKFSFPETNPLEFEGYIEKKEALRTEINLHDAIISGTCQIDGYKTVIAIMNKKFMMASMGMELGEIVVNQKTTAAHHVEIRVESDDIRNKFTILGFGLVK